MPVHFIKPNAAFSDTGGCLTLNDYTNLREGVANADSTPGLRTVTNDVGNTTLAVCSTTDNMPETPTSLNSVTFRARGRFQSWTDDISIYRAYANVPNYGSYQLSWAQNNYGSGAWGEISTTLPTTLTLSELNGITFEFHQYQYGRQMGGDGVYFEMDCMEVEVNYNTTSPRNVTCTTEVIAWDGTNHDATVTTSVGREVNGSTQALTFTETKASVPIDRTIDALAHAEQLAWTMPDATVSRPTTTISGKTAKPKQWRALPWSQWWVDGHTGIYGSHDAATIGNALDQNLVTKYDPISYQMPIIQGIETLGPQSSPTALPAGIKVRWYISGAAGAYVAAFAGWRPQERSEHSGNYLDGYENIGTITVPASGEGWTEWMDCNLAYNVQGRSSGTQPYSWSDIQNSFTVTHWHTVFGGNIYIHGIQILVEEAEPANFISGYVNASHGWTDEKGAWTGHANAWDGSETTFAGTVWGSAGTYVGDYLDAAGNTLTQGAAEEEVRSVWFRAKLRGQYTPTDERLSCILYPYHPDYYDWSGDSIKFPVYDGKDLLNYNNRYFAAPNDTDINAMWDFAATNTAFWTPWYKLDFDSLHADWAGWRRWKSWGEIQKMGFRLYRGPDPDLVSTLEISKVEYLVLAEPPNTTRGGGKVKKDRGVNGGVEAITMAGTQATVSFATPRTVTCTTEAISFAEGAATVARPRAITGATEVVSMVGTPATVHAFVDRNVNCTTEAITFTEAAATLNATRGVLGATELLSLAESAATIDKVRGVVCTAEAISFTESAANISFATHRTVTGLTEAITMPATASVNLARGVSSSPETLQLAEVASTVNASRVTSGVTEVLSSTSAGTNVDTARGVQSGTEALIYSESSSAINRERGVVGATETLTLTESQATIGTTSNLDVTCTTEAISFTETPASVNGTRIAAGTVEITAFVENASAVNAKRVVSATTETLALTDNDSTVTFGRVVAATTESISLVEGSSTVDRQRGVNAGTEAISLTESAANVNGKRIAAASAELVALAENAASINRARNTIGVTESVTISENASVVDRQRGVNAGTEAVVMTESLSTVLRGANLDVVCTTEAIALAENAAAISADRAVNAVTEVVSLDALASDTNFNRTVLTTSESVVMTESQATVDTAASNNPRNVTCTTEAVSFVETAANVNGLRIVGAGVELTALAESAASVNLTREVVSATEALALAEASASVNLSRTVNSLTDQLVMAESAANVSTTTSRIVNAVTESLVTSSSATSNQTRGVLSSTEILGLAAQSSSIQVLRNVVATTEQLALAEAGAAVLTNRDVAGLTSSLLMTESAGQVFRGANLDVVGAVAAMSLVETAAAIAFPRNVSGLTEQLSLTAVPATLNRPWLVICASEELSFTEGLAKIDKTRTGAMPGSMVWVHPDIKPVWVSD